MMSYAGLTRRLAVSVLPALGISLILPPPARAALTFQFTYDGSYYALSPNAQTQISTALTTVASEYAAAISNTMTVDIQIGWGTIAGSASSMPSGAVGYTLDNYYTGLTYSNVRSYLSSFGGAMPLTNPTTASNIYIPNAEAKALGLTTNTQLDGYIGFASGVGWTFDDTNGVAANTYDFMGVAKQEIGHVLGRISGLTVANSIFAYPLDFFRYSGKGVTTFTYKAAAYASINSGNTSLGTLDDTGADASDWLNNVNCSTVKQTVMLDAENAVLCPGNVLTLSPQDLTVLHTLGYVMTGDTTNLDSTAVTPYGATIATTPEPAGLSVLALGGMVLFRLRRRRGQTNPAHAA
ncbi:MAG: NF038122 family metalloprotease [Acetobacteraceae bacterium]|nr:NF038122 family metalloprotease [Acetobacteraceae bacterium]